MLTARAVKVFALGSKLEISTSNLGPGRKETKLVMEHAALKPEATEKKRTKYQLEITVNSQYGIHRYVVA